MWPQTALTFSASSHQVDWHNTEPAFVDRITMSVYVERAQIKRNKGGLAAMTGILSKRGKKIRYRLVFMVPILGLGLAGIGSPDLCWQGVSAAFRSSVLLSLVSHQPLSNMLHITYTVTSTAVP